MFVWRALILQLHFLQGDASNVLLGSAACSDASTDECSSFLQANSKRSITSMSKVTNVSETPRDANQSNPLGNVTFANWSAKNYMFIHIPKCAGTSFRADASLVVAPSYFQENREESFQSTPRGDSQIDMIIFRSPLVHILSQFMECKYDFWGNMAVAGTDFPARPGLYGGLAEWINHFVELKDAPLDGALPDTEEWAQIANYRCYNPWNMQTRYLATEWSHSAPFNSFEPNLQTAVGALNRVQFVGLSEFYIESLCLLNLHRHGTVPETCACGGRGPLAGTSHLEHFVPDHAISDLPPAVVKQMRKLVRLDAQIYAMVLKRFETELRHASEISGVQMFCPEKFDTMWVQVDHLLGELGLANVTSLKRSAQPSGRQ